MCTLDGVRSMSFLPSRVASSDAMLCGVTQHTLASWAPDSGVTDSAWSAEYCGTVRPNGLSARCFSAINACSARLMNVPVRQSSVLAIRSSTGMAPTGSSSGSSSTISVKSFPGSVRAGEQWAGGLTRCRVLGRDVTVEDDAADQGDGCYVEGLRRRTQGNPGQELAIKFPDLRILPRLGADIWWIMRNTPASSG
jgi:hypothetical protein